VKKREKEDVYFLLFIFMAGCKTPPYFPRSECNPKLALELPSDAGKKGIPLAFPYFPRSECNPKLALELPSDAGKKGIPLAFPYLIFSRVFALDFA